MVLYCRGMFFALRSLSSIKVGFFLLFIFVLNSIYPPHVLLHFQQDDVRWQNSSVKGPPSPLSNVSRLHQRNSHWSRLCPVVTRPPSGGPPLVRLVCGNAAPLGGLGCTVSHSVRLISKHRQLDEARQLYSPIKSRCDNVSVCKQIVWSDLWMCVSDRKDWCTRFESSPEHSACVFFVRYSVQLICCHMFILYLQ